MASDEGSLEERVETLERRVAELENLIEDGAVSEVANMRAFVESTSPETHADRALAIGFYLEQYEGLNHLTTGDIKEGYSTCRVPEPANMSDTLRYLAERELLLPAEHDGRGNAWRLSAEGERSVREWGQDREEDSDT